jgi:hypothetical protein
MYLSPRWIIPQSNIRRERCYNVHHICRISAILALSSLPLRSWTLKGDISGIGPWYRRCKGICCDHLCWEHTPSRLTSRDAQIIFMHGQLHSILIWIRHRSLTVPSWGEYQIHIYLCSVSHFTQFKQTVGMQYVTCILVLSPYLTLWMLRIDLVAWWVVGSMWNTVRGQHPRHFLTTVYMHYFVHIEYQSHVELFHTDPDRDDSSLCIWTYCIVDQWNYIVLAKTWKLEW